MNNNILKHIINAPMLIEASAVPGLGAQIARAFYAEFKKFDAARAEALSLDGRRRAIFVERTEDGSSRINTDGFYVLKEGVYVVPIKGAVLTHAEIRDELYYDAVSPERTAQVIESLAQNPDVKLVILDVDSPGGTVSGTPELSRAISELAKQKQVLAYTDGLMCSAAYYAVCGAHSIIASQSAVVGSIGVILGWLDATGFYQKFGASFEVFTAGKFKGIGFPGRELTPEIRELLQRDIDEIHEEFKAAVRAARPGVSDEAMQGQTFRTARAIKENLADEMATWNELLKVVV